MGCACAPGTRPPPTPPRLLLPRLLLSLLLLSPTVRGDCGPPPEIPNATTDVDKNPPFPENSYVAYSCIKGFQKIPDKENTAFCQNGQWSSLETFCNKSCGAPTRIPFASLKKEYINMNYFPVGSTVEYECRSGFRRHPSLSGKSTCQENLEWSKVAEICRKKSCPNPGEIKNGHINITTDILFGSEIFFSCDTGYKLVGSSSAYCFVMGNTVGWSDPFPVCTEIFCPEPPKIDNGAIRVESDTYAYRHVVTYVCDKGFVLVGRSSIYCTVSNNNQGEWSDQAPQCIEKSKIPTSPKTTTANVPSTRLPLTSQKPTTAKVPGTRVPSLSQKPTTVNVPSTRLSLTSQKPTTVNVPHTRLPLTSPVPGTGVSPVSQKPTTAKVPGTRVPLKPQKPTTVNVLGTRATTNPPKPTKANIPSTVATPMPQKPNTANVLVTEDQPTSQKPNTTNVIATEIVSIPQKPNTVNILATEDPLTPQETSTANVLATEISSTLQKPSTVNALVTEDPSTPQKTNTANVPATEIPPTPQKTHTAAVPAADVSPTPQKSVTAKISTTKPATSPISHIPDTVSAKSPPITQTPTTVNASTAQTAQTTRRSATAKSSLTQPLPATQRPTFHTKALQTVTQRFTSAHITATQHVPATKTTTHHPTRTSKERERSTSDGVHLIYGKFDSQGANRNCHHCGNHNRYFWKRILSFNCLRNTVKMWCYWAPKGRRANVFYQRVLWTPLGIRYVPSYSHQCSCSKVVLGQLQIIWPIRQVALSARCVSMLS